MAEMCSFSHRIDSFRLISDLKHYLFFFKEWMISGQQVDNAGKYFFTVKKQYCRALGVFFVNLMDSFEYCKDAVQNSLTPFLSNINI